MMGDLAAEAPAFREKSLFQTISAMDVLLNCCTSSVDSSSCRAEIISRDRRGRALRKPGGAWRDRSPPPPPSSHRGCRPEYALGDVLRAPSHAVAAPAAVCELAPNDFAFVRRSDGLFTYAIVAHRHREPRGILDPGTTARRPSGGGDFLVFVVSPEGHTKTVERRQWGALVRASAPADDGAAPRPAVRINPHWQPPSLLVVGAADALLRRPRTSSRRPSCPATCALPSTISCVLPPPDEEVSLISNISSRC